MSDRVKVLVVGQTPPPFHGQGIMIERFLKGRFTRLELHHVRMAFSSTIEEVGRVRPRKLLHLGEVIGRILAARARYGAKILYYPPAGPLRVPMLRDIAILLATRRAFARTVFHFHAGGLTGLLDQLSPAQRYLFRRAYGKPDVAIRLTPETPEDGARLEARHEYVIPYGIEDHAARLTVRRSARPSPVVLFVGAHIPTKGVMVLLEAFRLLLARDVAFEGRMVGRFASAAFETEARQYVADAGLAGRVQFEGELTGDAKWQAYADADIFCFPTFYSSETFGLVVLEAMQFGLPVIATRWRGIPSLLRHGECGDLVAPHDPLALADTLDAMIRNPERRQILGARGRAIYVAEHSLERWYARMEEAILAANT